MSSVTYSNIAITKVLLLRGNTIQNDRYTGLPGEPTVDTELYQLRLHDGSTPGGHIISGSGGGGNSLINGNNIVSLDSNGGLNLANVGLIRAPNNGAGPINLASDTFVQMQWSANANTVDPNADWTGSTTWVYVDNGGFHVEAITPGHDAYWAFDPSGNFTFPDNTIQTTAFSNIALANYLAGTVTIGNLTVQGNITTVNSEIIQHNEIVAGNITSNSFVTAQYFQGNGSLLTGLPAGYSNVQVAEYLPIYHGSAYFSNVSASGNVTIGGNLIVYGNIITYGNVTQVLTTVYGNTGQFFGNVNGFGALYAGIGTGYTVEPQTILQLSSNYNGYSQLNLQNINSGTSASGDIVVTMDTGNTSQGYIDLGINSSQFVGGPGNELNYPGDGYLYVFGNSVTGGNLLISTSLAKDIVFSVNGQGSANQIGRFSQSANAFQVTGNITATGNVTAVNFVGSGQFLTGLPTQYSNVNVAAYLTANPVTVSSLTNGSYSFTLQSQGYLTVPTSTYGTAQMFSSAGVPLFIGTLDSGNYWQLKTGGILQFPDNTQQTTAFSNTAPIIQVLSANSYQQQAQIGNLQASAYSNVNVIAYLAGNITVGNISAHYFTGNGSQLTGLPAGYSNVQVAAYLVGYTGNVAAGNITANYVYATNYVSTGAVYSPVIGNTGAYITGANVNIAGNVNATYFVGNGRFLTGIITGSGSNYGNSNVAAYLPTYFGNIGNVTVGNLTITGIKNNVPVKAGGFVAQNTAVSMDSVTTQWLNNGGANANQLQLAALNGNVSILYTYIFEAGTGGSPSGGSSTTTLANLSFGWTSIGNASGVAGDMYNVLVSLPGVNAYRITAMTGSGYSNNVLTIERLI